jgi:hypothetical protein
MEISEWPRTSELPHDSRLAKHRVLGRLFGAWMAGETPSVVLVRLASDDFLGHRITAVVDIEQEAS